MAGLTAKNSRVSVRVFFSHYASFWSYGVVHCCIQQAGRALRWYKDRKVALLNTLLHRCIGC